MVEDKRLGWRCGAPPPLARRYRLRVVASSRGHPQRLWRRLTAERRREKESMRIGGIKRRDEGRRVPEHEQLIAGRHARCGLHPRAVCPKA